MNPLESGEPFAMTLANPNPTSGKTKDGPVYRVSFELTFEEWQPFMDAHTKGMVIEVDLARVAHGKAAAPVPAEEPETRGSTPYGELARDLRLSGFLSSPIVRAACGTDADYREWLKRQKCAFSKFGGCGGDVVAAHFRITDKSEDLHGGGTGVKPDNYEEVSCCDTHHRLQHNGGYSAVADLGHWKYQIQEQRKAWVWASLKRIFATDSMALVPPALVFKWAKSIDAAALLPRSYWVAVNEKP